MKQQRSGDGRGDNGGDEWGVGGRNDKSMEGGNR